MARSLILSLILGLFACDGKKERADTGDDTSTGLDSGDSGETGDTGDSADTGDTAPTDEDGDTYSVEGGDCDDANPEVHPAAIEIWYDGVDQDCDGNDGDQDGDGDAKSGFGGTDCNDEDAGIFPGAAEVCDGLDQDCDGAIDEDASSYWFLDADADGYGDSARALAGCLGAPGYVNNADDCDDENALVNPIALDECDGKDNDCDGETDEGATTYPWYRDADDDGHGDSADFISSCYEPAGYAESWRDCDDTNAAVNPDAPELCDGLDNDCDGDVDPTTSADAGLWYSDADADGYGDPGSVQANCAQPTDTVASGDDCDDTTAAVSPDADESCNGVDDDCDGDTDEADATDALTWYTDADVDGYGDPATADLSCEGAADQVADDTDCDDANPAVSPAAAESCNTIDDDCDGDIDEAGALGETAWTSDGDGDGYGDDATAVTQCDAPADAVAIGGDCDDTDATLYPSAPELCDDIDQDCDGATADEAGTATWFDDSGAITDVTADLAAGTATTPVVIGDAASADVIVGEGVLQLCDGTWYARVALSDVNSDLTVVGLSGADYTTLTTAGSAGGPNVSVVSVTDATLTIQGLTIADGLGTSGSAGGGVAAVRSTTYTTLPSVPTVTLIDSVVRDNNTRFGGGIAIYGASWVELIDSLVAENTASLSGGGFWIQNNGQLSCAATTLGGAGVIANTAPTGGGGYLGATSRGTVDSVGCDWGQDSTADDNATYDIQQLPSASDYYCYPNAASLTDTVSCAGGSCTATTDTTCP